MIKNNNKIEIKEEKKIKMIKDKKNNKDN